MAVPNPKSHAVPLPFIPSSLLPPHTHNSDHVFLSTLSGALYAIPSPLIQPSLTCVNPILLLNAFHLIAALTPSSALVLIGAHQARIYPNKNDQPLQIYANFKSAILIDNRVFCLDSNDTIHELNVETGDLVDTLVDAVELHQDYFVDPFLNRIPSLQLLANNPKPKSPSKIEHRYLEPLVLKHKLATIERLNSIQTRIRDSGKELDILLDCLFLWGQLVSSNKREGEASLRPCVDVSVASESSLGIQHANINDNFVGVFELWVWHASNANSEERLISVSPLDNTVRILRLDELGISLTPHKSQNTSAQEHQERKLQVRWKVVLPRQIKTLDLNEQARFDCTSEDPLDLREVESVTIWTRKLDILDFARPPTPPAPTPIPSSTAVSLEYADRDLASKVKDIVYNSQRQTKRPKYASQEFLVPAPMTATIDISTYLATIFQSHVLDGETEINRLRAIVHKINANAMAKFSLREWDVETRLVVDPSAGEDMIKGIITVIGLDPIVGLECILPAFISRAENRVRLLA